MDAIERPKGKRRKLGFVGKVAAVGRSGWGDRETINIVGRGFHGDGCRGLHGSSEGEGSA